MKLQIYNRLIIAVSILCFCLISAVMTMGANIQWGIAGSDCGMFNMILEDYGDEGETAISSALQGFLTGYNLSLPERKHRIINYNSTDFLMSYMKKYCKKKGKDGRIYEGMIQYYKTLPYFIN